MAKLGLNKHTLKIIGLGAAGLIGFFWLESYLVKPGRAKVPFTMPHFPIGAHPPPAPPPAVRAAPPMARAHLANQLPIAGPPSRHTLGVGGGRATMPGLVLGHQISGYGSGGGMYDWPSGRIGHKGGYGVAGGYAGYSY